MNDFQKVNLSVAEVREFHAKWDNSIGKVQGMTRDSSLGELADEWSHAEANRIGFERGVMAAGGTMTEERVNQSFQFHVDAFANMDQDTFDAAVDELNSLFG